MYLPVVGVDVGASVYADVDDDAIPVADMAKAVPQIGQHDPRIDYLVHDEDDQLDQLFVLLGFVAHRHIYRHTH